MAAFQNFRGAFNGFNREDVVRYIELMNHQHAAEVTQLKNQLLAAEAELAQNREQPDVLSQLEAARERARQLEVQAEAAQARIRQLEAELEQLRPRTEAELEAYRRAERAERIANERVAQMFAQATGILAEATTRTDETAAQVGQLTEQICAQLAHLQETLNAGAEVIRGSAAAMYALKPAAEEE